MSPISALRLLFLSAAIISSLPARDPVAHSLDDALKTAWENTALGLFNTANAEFAELSGDEARLGEAVTLLLRQPKTDGNVNRAADLFAALVNESTDPSLAIRAKYHLARIAQTHRTPNDPETARRLFRELIAAHPGHPYAELATVKLAILELYDPVPDDVRRTRFDDFARAAVGLESSSARRDLNFLLADVSQRFGYDPSLTLDFLLAADRSGVARQMERGNTWVRIGQLAQENGRVEIAREYYNKYLAAFIRDNRRRMIMERLAVLPDPEADQ